MQPLRLNTLLRAGALIVCALGLSVPQISYAGAAIGNLSKVLGSVNIVRAGKSTLAKSGDEIFETDILQTGARSAAKISFKDGSSFMAMENAKIRVDEYKIKGSGSGLSLKSAISVGKGVVRFFVKPREGKGKNNASFRTANAVMGIRGTSGFIDNTEPSKTKLVVLTGKVEVASRFNPQKAVMVIPNHITEVIARNPPAPPVQAPAALMTSLNSQAAKVEPVSEGMLNKVTPESSVKPADDKGNKVEENNGGKNETQPEQKIEDKKQQKPAGEQGNKNGGVESKSSQTSTQGDAPIKKPEKAHFDRDTTVYSPVADTPQLTPVQPRQIVPAGKVESSLMQKAATSPAQQQPSGLPDLKETTQISRKVDGIVNNTIQKVEPIKESDVVIDVPHGPIHAK